MDPDSKIYIEYAPYTTAREELIGLQTRITRSVPGLSVPANELHVTLIHIGKLSNLLAELRGYGAILIESSVEAALQVFITKSQVSLPQEISFVPSGLKLYGSRQSVIVVEGTVDDQAVAAYATCLHYLKDFLYTIIKADPTDFMRHSHTLRHSLELSPHVSLVRSSRQMLPQPHPIDLGLPDVLRFTALPLLHDLKHSV